MTTVPQNTTEAIIKGSTAPLGPGMPGNTPLKTIGVMNPKEDKHFQVLEAMRLSEAATGLSECLREAVDLIKWNTNPEYSRIRFEASTAPVRGSKAVSFIHDTSSTGGPREVVAQLHIRRLLGRDEAVAHIAMATLAVAFAGRGIKVLKLKDGLIDPSSRYTADAAQYAAQIGVIATATEGDSQNHGDFTLMNDREAAEQAKRAPGGECLHLKAMLDEGPMAGYASTIGNILASFSELQKLQAKADATKKAGTKAGKKAKKAKGRREAPKGTVVGKVVYGPDGETVLTVRGVDITISDLAEGYTAEDIEAKAGK